jgi:hypothetical protein
MDCSVNAEISELKKLMTNTAEKYDFDLQHPAVIEISQKLDVLILEAMQEQQPGQRGKDAAFSFRHITNELCVCLVLHFNLFLVM